MILRQGAQLAQLFVFPSGLWGGDFPSFSTTDCTGTVFVASPPRDPEVDIIATSTIFDGWVYQAKVGAPRRAVTLRSNGGAGGECSTIPSDFVWEQDVYPAVRIMNLNGRWTPPFRIR